MFEARGRHVRLPAEVREEGGAIRIVGYAAVFNQETNIGGMFREMIAPGAFTDAIGRDDVTLLVDHEGLPLARTASGTLRLSQDDHGLKVESELDGSDPDVARLVPKMRRGDLSKMSFAFMIEKNGQIWEDDGDLPLRTVTRASLHDVSIVGRPAYEGTEVGLRSLEAFRRAKNYQAARARVLDRQAEQEQRFRGLV